MYEHFLLYWYIWMMFIIVYFFMDISMKRSALLWWILVVISTANMYVDIGVIQLSIGFIVILLGGVIYFLETAVSAMKLIYAFTIMIGYGGLLMWHQIAPIWFFLPVYIIVPILMVGLVLLLEKSIRKGYTTLLIGMSFGQLMYQCILVTYYLTDTIGGINYLIHISSAIFLLTFMYGGHLVMNFISSIVHRKLI